MKVGIVLCSTPDAWQDAKHAESLGFDSVWFWDSPAAAGDAFVSAALTAQLVPRLRIGFAVYVPWSRNPLVTASLLGSLNVLAPGRIDICYGTGFTARRCVGLPPMRLQEVRDHYLAVRGLLAGDEVSLKIEGRQTTCRLIHPHLLNLSDPIQFHLAASGPRGRNLAAELECGWLDAPATFDPQMDPVREMHEAWQQSGKETDALQARMLLPATVVDDLADRADFLVARQRLAPFALAGVHYWVDEHLIQKRPLPLSLPSAILNAIDAYRDVIARDYEGKITLQQLHAGHCLYVRPDEEHVVSPDLLSTVTLSMPAATLRHRMDRLRSQGVTEVLFPVLPGDRDNMECLSKALVNFNF